jgi:DNA processing protein
LSAAKKVLQATVDRAPADNLAMADTLPYAPLSIPVGGRIDPRWDPLWIHGDPSALASPVIAIIGTRMPDPAARALAHHLARDLARHGVRVLSGGALGIDEAAHLGALDGDGRTAVVLPCGLEHCYPRRHASLYRTIVASGGALISQFPPETPPTAWTFPRRNELVAALADVMVVVQAPDPSGALIAADAARRAGRRLMAVPASPFDRRARGNVRLLRAGARPCVTADDVLAFLSESDGALFARDALHAPVSTRATRTRSATTRAPDRALPRARGPDPLTLDEAGSLVYEALAVGPRHIEEVARAAALSTSRAQQVLLTLVLAGFIEDRGGGMFTRADA